MIGEPPLSLGGLHLKSMQVDELSIISTGPRGVVGLSIVTQKNNLGYSHDIQIMM